MDKTDPKNAPAYNALSLFRELNMPKIDTSNANVARVLRELIGYLRDIDFDADTLTAASALADALEQRDGPTWAERVERLARHLESTSTRICGGDDADARNRAEYDKRAEAALRASFPEYAP